MDSPFDWKAPLSSTPAPAHQPERLRLDGRRLVTPSGKETRLRGVNVCSFEFDAFGAHWRQASDGTNRLLDVLVDPLRWNANAVRMPVNQEWFLSDPAYVERIEAVIDAAAVRGLYVILDVQWEHAQRTEPYHLNILPEPTFGAGNTTEAFWFAASGRFANRFNMLFDLINEPHDVPFSKLHQSFQMLVDLIGLRAPETLIVAGGPDWAHRVEAYRDRPLQGERVIYSAHQYLPYDAPEQFVRNFESTAMRRPVLIGEFEPSRQQVAGRLYAEVLIERAEASGVVGWLPWAIGCGMSIDDDRGNGSGARIAALMRNLNVR